jgi:molybdopterin-binding protein
MKTKYLYAFLGLFLIAFTGCTDNADIEAGVGRLTIQLTDAPFPLDLISEANVTIYKIEARQKGDTEYDSSMEDEGNMEDESEDMHDGSGIVVLMEDEISVNLLDLTNGVTEFLVDREILAGTYDQLRVYAKGINVVMNDEEGTTYDLKIPSGEQSGIKIKIKPALTIVGGLSADLLLDFDVSRSFVPRGNIRDMSKFNGFIFKPVIKVSNMATAGTLAGVVTDISDGTALVDAQITVSQDGEEITSSFTDETGGYMIMGLEAGSYVITVIKEGYITIPEPEAEIEVNIDAGNRTTINFEMTPDV